MHDLLPLNCLRAGQFALVAQLLGTSEHVHRLQELGLRDGVEVAMVQPGVPCIIRLAGQKLCFRADELTSVLVRPGRAT
jgi:Fe2+ transport system protein FeoA